MYVCVCVPLCVYAWQLAGVEERVRALSARKDETIHKLQTQLASSQAELHTAREQLHATQQEILAFQ